MRNEKKEFYNWAKFLTDRIGENYDRAFVIQSIRDCAEMMSMNRILKPIDLELLHFIARIETEMEKLSQTLSMGLEHEYSLVKGRFLKYKDALPAERAAFAELGAAVKTNEAFTRLFHEIDIDSNTPANVKPFGEAASITTTPLISILAVFLLEVALTHEIITHPKHEKYRMVRLSNHCNYSLEDMARKYERINRGVLEFAFQCLPLLISEDEISEIFWSDSRASEIRVGRDKTDFIRDRGEFFELRKCARGEPEMFSPVISQVAVVCGGIMLGCTTNVHARDYPRLYNYQSGWGPKKIEGMDAARSSQIIAAHIRTSAVENMFSSPDVERIFGDSIMSELGNLPFKQLWKTSPAYSR